MNAISLVLILGSLLPGSGYTDAVEIPGQEGKRCFCYDPVFIPAVFVYPERDTKSFVYPEINNTRHNEAVRV